MNPPPVLLTITARVLQAAGDLPPLIVEAGPDGPAPVMIGAADLAPSSEARTVVHAIAQSQGWEVDALPEGDGWSTTGIVDSVRVAAVGAAGPLGALPAEEGRHPGATAAQAALLTALAPWADGLPEEEVLLLQVMERPAAGLEVHLEVTPDGMRQICATHPVVAGRPAPRLSSWDDDGGTRRAEGMLPTGHRLMIKTSW